MQAFYLDVTEEMEQAILPKNYVNSRASERAHQVKLCARPYWRP